LSLQFHHHNLNFKKLPEIRESPQRAPGFDSYLDTITQSLVESEPPPKRRNACFLDLLIIKKLQQQYKSTKTKSPKLREQIRRKSCYCNCCGGLSKLEKKTLHLKFPAESAEEKQNPSIVKLDFFPEKSEPNSMVIHTEILTQSNFLFKVI